MTLSALHTDGHKRVRLSYGRLCYAYMQKWEKKYDGSHANALQIKLVDRAKS